MPPFHGLMLAAWQSSASVVETNIPTYKVTATDM